MLKKSYYLLKPYCLLKPYLLLKQSVLLALYLGCGAILLPLSAIAATEFKIIDLQYRFAEEIIPTIQNLAGADGAVTGMQNHLIVRASPEKMREIEQAIAALDVVRQNLKITVSRSGAIQNEQSGINVAGRKRFGNIEITGNSRPQPSKGNSKEEIRLDIEKRQSSSTTKNLQYISVIEGETAFIRVGQSVPFSQEWIILKHHYTKLQKTTEFIDIDTCFIVSPRILGNVIEVTITPRIAQLNQSGTIDFEEHSTTVRVPRGEWLDLSGTMQQNDEVSRAILGQNINSQSQNSQLSILVE